jgi:hypothetical protein
VTRGISLKVLLRLSVASRLSPPAKNLPMHMPCSAWHPMRAPGALQCLSVEHVLAARVAMNRGTGNAVKINPPGGGGVRHLASERSKGDSRSGALPLSLPSSTLAAALPLRGVGAPVRPLDPCLPAHTPASHHRASAATTAVLSTP